MLKKFMLVLAIFVCVGQFFILPIFQSGAYAAAEKKEYILGAHFESAAGLGSAQMLDIVNTVVNLLQEKTGITLNIERFLTYDDAFNAFIKNKTDSIFVQASDMILLKEKDIEVLPFLSSTINGKDKDAYCLWQKKDKTYLSLSDIIDTTLLGEFNDLEDTIITMERLRDYLYKQGIDKPLWKVFKNFQKVANVNSAFLAVGAGKGDLLWQGSGYEFALKLMMPSIFAHISYKFCTDRLFDFWTIVFNKKTVDAKDYKTLVEETKAVVENYKEIFKKDKKLKPILQVMKTVKLAPAIATSVPYQEEVKLWEKSKKNGWYEESKFLAEKLLKAEKGELVTIKFTYEDCKPKCKKAKDPIACMDECMK